MVRGAASTVEGTMRRLILSGVFAAHTFLASAQGVMGYYRFPAIHGDTLVFTAEGDLWRASLNGGVAQRLTTHPGRESRAAISTDGRTIAFSGSYEGPTEVYTMPISGGLPVRQTFDGASAWVVGWTPDGRVLFRTLTHSTLPEAQLVSLDPKTGDRRLLPLAQAAEGAYEPTGKTLFFTRLPHQGSSTKRYEGGSVENLWRFGTGDSEAVPLASEYKGTSRNPMWWQGRVYFVSDRDGVMNLWSMKPDGSDLKQLTKHVEFDVKTASLDQGRIVYSRGADLRLYDISSSRDRALSISLASDQDQEREHWIKKPSEFLTAAHLSPTGDRLVLTARGQVFVAPQGQGRFVEVPRKPGVRYRDAQFLNGGKTLVAQSDESGEVEFWTLPASGVGGALQQTTNARVFRHPAVASPDGKRLAWGDKNSKFWVHDLDKKATTLIGDTKSSSVTDITWSPDSQWIAYVDEGENSYRQIYLYNLTTGSRTSVTSERVDSFSPAWSPDGKWLYFLSDRELRSLVGSPWGPRQPEPFFTETTKIYAVALKPDQAWPFAPKTELLEDDAEKKETKPDADPAKGKELAKTNPSDKEGSKSGATNKPSGVTVEIELGGLSKRLFEVPTPAGNYDDLKATAKHLLWTSREVGFAAKTQLRQLEITRKDPKPKVLVEELASYEVSGDGKKLLIRKGDAFYVIAADASAPVKLEDSFDLSAWTFSIQPREEWRQIYTESWRMLRDYFYDRDLHGLEWRKIHDKYLPLVDRVSDRAELNDVIAEMAGELSALHIFVRFGDEREGPDAIKAASLGAQLVRDAAAGGWRVEHIYRTDPDYPASESPLVRPGVEMKEGDTITSINGRSTLDVSHSEMLLRNQAGRQVRLEVKTAGATTNHPVIVQPVTVEQAALMRYSEWEYTRRLAVDSMSSNQIGYVHLRAMGTDNIAEWAREYYPVFKRQGLILDVRHNRGGNIDSWILSRLLRKAWFYWQPRTGDPTWNMQYAFRGHLVVLCDHATASDGEAFSEGFKRLGLGKVIGTRTWGGEIWLSARRWLVDNGMASAAEIGVYGPEGAWLIEGHGVDPDIVVDNLPHATAGGRDAQLEAAVNHLQELIAKDPRPVPPAPKYPNKRFPK
jgi:tricorn protease